MASRDELYGLEFDFVVSDQDGLLAVFSSAGYGRVPVAALDRDAAETEFVDGIDSLPVTAEAVITGPQDGDLSFWVERCKRGYYTYDWRVWDGPYLRVAVPTSPLRRQADVIPFDPVRVAGRFCDLAEVRPTDFDGPCL